MKRETGILLCCVGTLLALGAVMEFSILSTRGSAVAVGIKYLVKHVLWVGVALGGFAVMWRLDYRWLERRHRLIGLGMLALLAAVLIPFIGTEVNGARRWIRFGSFGFQTSEVAKLLLLIAVCGMAARLGDDIRDFRRGFLPCMAVVGAASALILAEPDFGTAALVAAVGTLVVLAAGGPLLPLIGAGAAGAAALSFLIWKSPTRFERVLAFLDPWKYRQGAGYQLIQSLMSLGSGGLFGRGPGASVQKLFFLPEPDTDFVFSIIGEEYGLAGALGVILLLVVIVRQGMLISRAAPDAFAKLLAFGVTSMIALQALIHIAVVTGSMPTKGIALPFVSSGGSSLLVSMMGVGVLINIAGRTAPTAAGEPGSIPTREVTTGLAQLWRTRSVDLAGE